MTINYQNNSLTFLPDGTVACGATMLPRGTDVQECLRQLVEGQGDFAVCGVDARQLVLFLHENYIFIKAAGGVVERPDGKRLLMIRNDRADLPKGKVEAGETLAQAALRETQEETGLSDIRRGSLLLKTYHIYDLYGGWHFKQTSWYAMQLLGEQPLVPQTEEGITSLEWCDAAEWRAKLLHSYATMRIITSQVPDTRLFNSNS